MRRTVILALASLATLAASMPAAQAQDRVTYRPGGFTINVRPRSFLDAGNVVAPYSSVNPASAYGQMVSYLNSPPYANRRDQFGEGTLPDPVTNGPFVGARSPFDPIDYEAPYVLR